MKNYSTKPVISAQQKKDIFSKAQFGANNWYLWLFTKGDYSQECSDLVDGHSWTMHGDYFYFIDNNGSLMKLSKA